MFDLSHEDYGVKIKILTLGTKSRRNSIVRALPEMEHNSSELRSSPPPFNNYYEDYFDENCLIGVGGFGSVFKAQHKLDNVTYAIKKIKFRPENRNTSAQVLREVQQLARLNHVNVVSYKNTWIADCRDSEESGSSGFPSESSSYEDSLSKGTSSNIQSPRQILYIQTEYCDTDLRSWLDQRFTKGPDFIPMTVMNIFYQILSGVAYIHSKSIIHRDIKPNNILLCKEEKVVKISDFGLACLVEQTDGANSNGSLSAGLGTPPYRAPEQTEGGHYSFSADIYSLGILLLEMLSICKTQSELCMLITNACCEQFNAELLDKFEGHVLLIKDMIKNVPIERPTAKKILSNSLFEKKSMENRIQGLRNRFYRLCNSYNKLEDGVMVLARGQQDNMIQMAEIIKNRKKTEISE